MVSLVLVPVAALADNNVVLDTDVSVLTLTPDEWQGNEDYFLVLVQTGINTSKNFQIIIPDGFNAIIECNVLDGTGDGHLIAYDSNQTVNVTVENGLVGLCTAKAGEALFTERWNVLETNDWARKDIQPLSSWGWTAK